MAVSISWFGGCLKTAGVVGIAKQTVEHCIERTDRNYEQGADAVRIGDYVRRWRQWVRGGLDRYELAVVTPSPPCIADKTNGTDTEED
jgi:hypothetical protein